MWRLSLGPVKPGFDPRRLPFRAGLLDPALSRMNAERRAEGANRRPNTQTDEYQIEVVRGEAFHLLKIPAGGKNGLKSSAERKRTLHS
jgi:hypothetical protein